MAQKTLMFCDSCGEEMREVALTVSIQGMTFFITQDQAPAIDVCKHCLLDAFMKLDDRPQEPKEI